jgi:hypothetical protein
VVAERLQEVRTKYLAPRMDPGILYATDDENLSVLDFKTKRDNAIMKWLRSFDFEENGSATDIATSSDSFDELDQIAKDIWVAVPVTQSCYDAMAENRKKSLRKNDITLLLKNWMHQIDTPYPATADKIRVAQLMGIPLDRVHMFARNFRKRFCVVDGMVVSTTPTRM